MRFVSTFRAVLTLVLLSAGDVISAPTAPFEGPVREGGQAQPASPQQASIAIAASVEGQPRAGRWAVILNGDGSSRHVRNCLDAYQALRANGFSDEAIYLLSSEPGESVDSAALLGPNDGPPSFRNLEAVFRTLRDEVKPQDTFVLYATGHGGQAGGEKPPRTFIELVPRERENEQSRGPGLDLAALSRHLAGLHPIRGLLVFDQCYGQRFAASLGKNPFVAIALSTKPEEVFCQNFSPVFWRELERSGHSRKRSSRTSVLEAFNRASRESRRRDHRLRPILRGGPSPSRFFLWD